MLFTGLRRGAQLRATPSGARLASHKGSKHAPPPSPLATALQAAQAAALRAAALRVAPAAPMPTSIPFSGPTTTSPAASVAPTARAVRPAEGTWRDFAGIAAMLTALLGVGSMLAGSQSSVSFRKRRVVAVKECLRSSATPKGRTAKSLGGRTLFARPFAVSALASLKKPGLSMLCGPKGDGKTSLVELLERANPFVTRVDLENGSMDKAVRAVAASIGYSLDYSMQELAAKAAGFSVPEIKAVQGTAEFEELLLVYEQACNELRTEGVLGGHVPVLILE